MKISSIDFLSLFSNLLFRNVCSKCGNKEELSVCEPMFYIFRCKKCKNETIVGI